MTDNLFNSGAVVLTAAEEAKLATLSSDDIIHLIDRMLARVSFPSTVEELREHRSEAKTAKLHLYDRQYLYKLAKRLGVMEATDSKVDGNRQQQKENPRQGGRYKSEAHSSSMERSEAIAILGLGQNPSSEEVKAQFKKLIQIYHPDKGGTDRLASQINAAHDLLLKDLA